jgi:hypothetical protein
MPHYLEAEQNSPEVQDAAIRIIGALYGQGFNLPDTLSAFTIALLNIMTSVDWANCNMTPGEVLAAMVSQVRQGMAMEAEYRMTGHG